MNMHFTPVSGAAPLCLEAACVAEPLDTGRANGLLMKLLAAFELVDDLGRLELETGNDSLLPFHLRLIGSTFTDTTCDLLDMIGHEETRQENATAKIEV